MLSTLRFEYLCCKPEKKKEFYINANNHIVQDVYGMM